MGSSAGSDTGGADDSRCRCRSRGGSLLASVADLGENLQGGQETNGCRDRQSRRRCPASRRSPCPGPEDLLLIVAILQGDAHDLFKGMISDPQDSSIRSGSVKNMFHWPSSVRRQGPRPERSWRSARCESAASSSSS